MLIGGDGVPDLGAYVERDSRTARHLLVLLARDPSMAMTAPLKERDARAIVSAAIVDGLAGTGPTVEALAREVTGAMRALVVAVAARGAPLPTTEPVDWTPRAAATWEDRIWAAAVGSEWAAFLAEREVGDA